MTPHVQPERISEYLDGRLSAADAAEIERHFESCPDCRREVESIRQTRDFVRSIGPPPPKSGFEERINAGVMADVAASKRTPWRRWAVAATVLLTGWAGYIALTQEEHPAHESRHEIAMRVETPKPPQPVPEAEVRTFARSVRAKVASKQSPPRPLTGGEDGRRPGEGGVSEAKSLADAGIAESSQEPVHAAPEEPEPAPSEIEEFENMRAGSATLSEVAVVPEIPRDPAPVEPAVSEKPLIVAQEKSVRLLRPEPMPLASPPEPPAPSDTSGIIRQAQDESMRVAQMPTPAPAPPASAPLAVAEPGTRKREDKFLAMMAPAESPSARYATSAPTAKSSIRAEAAAPQAATPAKARRTRLAPTQYVFDEPSEAWTRLAGAAARVGAWVDSRAETRWTVKFPDTSNAYAVLDAVLTASTSDTGTSVHVRWIAIPSSLDLNAASLDELMRLPGIDEYRAKMIDAYRYTYGPFENVEDLQEVPDISQEIYEAIKGKVRVNK